MEQIGEVSVKPAIRGSPHEVAGGGEANEGLLKGAAMNRGAEETDEKIGYVPHLR